MDPSSLYWWLALNRIPGVGQVIFKRLLDRFGSPEKVFQAGRRELLEIEGIRKNSVQAILRFRQDPGIEKELDLLDRLGIGILVLTDPLYPSLLAHIPDPPPFLYYRGRPSREDARSLAMVGSRLCSPYGVKITERLAWSLAKYPLTVVSGLARGIDSAAHRGALLAQGRTVAVLGSGLDVIYPSENKELFEEIVETGLVCSEYPPGTLPEKQHFPARNRIISGLALGTVIVEASQHSGSLITARLALEQGREVFAVPGSVESFKSSGTHRLIKQGAKLVEHAGDILEEFPFLSPEGSLTSKEAVDRPPEPALPEEQKKVWKALSHDPLHVDHISRETRVAAGPLLSLLLEMELKGVVKQLPGKLFVKI
jgi:DNA processing protein